MRNVKNYNSVKKDIKNDIKIWKKIKNWNFYSRKRIVMCDKIKR